MKFCLGKMPKYFKKTNVTSNPEKEMDFSGNLTQQVRVKTRSRSQSAEATVANVNKLIDTAGNKGIIGEKSPKGGKRGKIAKRLHFGEQSVSANNNAVVVENEMPAVEKCRKGKSPKGKSPKVKSPKIAKSDPKVIDENVMNNDDLEEGEVPFDGVFVDVDAHDSEFDSTDSEYENETTADQWRSTARVRLTSTRTSLRDLYQSCSQSLVNKPMLLYNLY